MCILHNLYADNSYMQCISMNNASIIIVCTSDSNLYDFTQLASPWFTVLMLVTRHYNSAICMQWGESVTK